jgi:hypothetical protein
MKGYMFEKYKVGDKIAVRNGHNEGRVGEIIAIEGRYVVLKGDFVPRQSYGTGSVPFIVTTYYQLKEV